MADIGPAAPLVSVGVPLYRSRRFVENIVANLDAIEYENVEVIVSDRHRLDDTLEVLRDRYGTDRRFRFLAATDGLGWVENFNLLLRESRGKYALWFPHDDAYPAGYIGELVSALERRPDAVLAFGSVERRSLDGFLPTRPFSPPPVGDDAAWSLGVSLRMLTLWQMWCVCRGLIRRDAVERWNLYIRRTRGDVRADIYWAFGLSLRGRLLYVPSCSCTKRFYRASTGAQWRFGVREGVDACRVLRSYLTDHARSRRDRVLGQLVLFPWCMAHALLPRPVGRRLRDFYEWSLAGRWARADDASGGR
jgi:glycosyltransferase involved in cell wall biosynthesis